MENQKTREIVKEKYGKIARQTSLGCGCGCGGTDAKEFAVNLGYSDTELDNIPEGSNLALSCGNPTALAELKSGEIVLDLGSGTGFDCFIAAQKVGDKGKVIGVDMTPEMVEKAKYNASSSGVNNVEFILGEIENLPLKDNSVDVIISNCVINLSTDKPKVFQEMYRVLKPSGRIAVSDIALRKELPHNLKEDVEAYVGCVAGAVLIEDYEKMVIDAGFSATEFTVKESMITVDLAEENKTEKIADYIVSLYVKGCK